MIFCASDEVNTIQQRPLHIHSSSGFGNTQFLSSDSISLDPYAVTTFSTAYYMILLSAFLSLLAVGITLIDCACYHTVFASSRHSSRGYERLVSSRSISVVGHPPSSTSNSSAVTQSRRNVFAIPVTSRSGASHSLATVDHSVHVGSSSLLPPPPPYSVSVQRPAPSSQTTESIAPVAVHPPPPSSDTISSLEIPQS